MVAVSGRAFTPEDCKQIHCIIKSMYWVPVQHGAVGSAGTTAEQSASEQREESVFPSHLTTPARAPYRVCGSLDKLSSI